MHHSEIFPKMKQLYMIRIEQIFSSFFLSFDENIKRCEDIFALLLQRSLRTKLEYEQFDIYYVLDIKASSF